MGVETVMAKIYHIQSICKYHIVFISKFRRMVIYNKLWKDIQEIMKQLCQWKGVEILERHMMPDYVYLLLEITSKMSFSYFMWYYVSTVGLNEVTIRKYIREQENEDKMEDKLTKKEYENPFKCMLK